MAGARVVMRVVVAPDFSNALLSWIRRALAMDGALRHPTKTLCLR